MSSDNEQERQVRETVKEAYAKAVTTGGGCCGTISSCCSGSTSSSSMKGIAAKVAGYDEQLLASLPAGSVENSFGCGNPLAFTEVRPGQFVLDLGSGAGIDLFIAAERVGPGGRVIGVDMTDEMIAKARENIANAGVTNIEVRKGIIEDLPVDTGSVDWVISNCVINLSPNKPLVFNEIARVLGPGGRMSVSDIVAEKLPDFFHEIPALYNSCIAGAIPEARYLDGLRAAGLVDVEVSERIVYDVAQLWELVRSELPLDDETMTGLLARRDEIAAAVEGQVWSAKIHARKP